MKKLLYLIVLSVFIIPQNVEGQSLGGYLKKKVEKSTKKRVDKEVDKAVDKAVNKSIDKMLNATSDEVEAATDSINNAKADSPEGNDGGEQRASEERLDAAMGNLMKSMGVGVDVPHKDVYTFNSYMNMHVEITNASGQKEDPMTYNTYFSDNGTDYGMEYKNEEGASKNMFVYDTDNNCTLILMDNDGQKTGIATGMSPEQMQQYEDQAKEYVEDKEMPEQYNLKKTGRTRTISGFKCTEYKAEDVESTVSLWVTNDLNKKINPNVYKNQMFGGRFWLAGKTEGVVIQYDNQSKTNKEHTIMTVKEVDFNKNHSISTVGYNLTGVNMGAQPKTE